MKHQKIHNIFTHQLRRAAFIVTSLCGLIFAFAVLTESPVLARSNVDDASQQSTIGSISESQLPREARQTLALIRDGGPFPFSKDGIIFGNYEKALPRQRRGYYHEYTVITPGARNRGARRIITGGDTHQPSEYYYTENHYRNFSRIMTRGSS